MRRLVRFVCLVAVAAAGAACIRPTPASAPSRTAPATPPAYASPALPPSSPSRVGTRETPAAPSFQVADLAFVDALHGWALGRLRTADTGGTVALRHTSDGGLSWQAVQAPGTDGAPPPVSHIRFASTRDGWAFGPGLFSTHDGGKSWRDESPPGEIIALETSGGVAWAIARTGGEGAGEEGQDALVYWTAQLGVWSKPTSPLPAADVADLLAAGEREAWLVCEDAAQGLLRARIWVTRDRGETWNEPAPAFSVPGEASLAMDDSRQLWLVSTGGPATYMQTKQVAVSADGGASWSRVADALPVGLDPAFPTPQFDNLPLTGIVSDVAAVSKDCAFIALTHGSVVGTRDGGRTWRGLIDARDLIVAGGGFRRVLFVDRYHGWAASGQDLIYRTDDGGLTWEQAAIP